MKKFLGILLSLVMILSLIPMTGVKAEVVGSVEVIIKADKTTAQPGDTIHYTLGIGAVNKMKGLEIHLGISDGLTLLPGTFPTEVGSGEEDDEDEDEIAMTPEEIALSDLLGRAMVVIISGIGGDNKLVVGGASYTSTEEVTLLEFDCKVNDDFVGEATVGLSETIASFGQTSVKGSDKQDGDLTLNCTPASVKVSVPVAGVTVDPTAMEVKIGQKKTVAAILDPTNATNQKVTFASDNTAVATVDAATGEVTAVAEGSANITATTDDGSFKAICKVTVPHKHTMVKIDAMESTCTKQGNNEYWQCSVCKNYYKEEAAENLTTVAAELKELKPHTEKTPATCKEQAVCSVCGKNYGDFAPHKLHANPAKEANHNNEGNIQYWDCTVCGKLFSDEDGKNKIDTLKDTVTDKIPHSYGTDWQKDETKHWKACGCGAIAEEAVHNMVWVETDPATEEHTGLKHKACDVCGWVDESTNNTEIPKLEHELTKVEAKDPTCQADGNVDYWTCKNCDNYFKDADAEEKFDSKDDVVIAKLDHKFDEETWKSDDKEHWHVCALCNTEKSDVAEHTYGDWKVTKPATTAETGSKEKECSVCGYKVTETIDMVEVGTSDGKLVVTNGQDAVDAAVAKNEAQKQAIEKIFGSSLTDAQKKSAMTNWFEKTTGYKADASKSVQVVAVADITLTGSAIMPAGGMDITLNVPGVKVGDNMYFLIHLKADGTWENIAATAGDGTLTGHFTSLSPVYVVKAENAEKIPESPTTSGVITNYWFWFVLLVAAFGATVVTRFVKRRNIYR